MSTPETQEKGQSGQPLKLWVTRTQEVNALYEIFKISSALQPYPVILQRIVEHISSSIRIPIVAIELYDEETQTMWLKAATGVEFPTERRVPVAKTLSGSVISSLTPVIAANPSQEHHAEFWVGNNAKTFACFPILADKTCLGALTLAHSEWAELSPDLQRWAANIAGFLGSFLAWNSRTEPGFESASELNDCLKALRSIQDLALEAHSFEELYEFFAAAHQQLSQRIPAENLYFAAYNPVNHKISFQYFSDSLQKESGQREYVDQDYIRLIAQSGEPLQLSNQPWLGVPVKYSDSIAGALVVYSHSPEITYGVKDKGLLECVAGVIAEVLDRRRVEQHLRLHCTQDELTRLPNATLFRTLLDQSLARARRNKDLVAVLILDLDHFKRFRNQQGERAASGFIKQTAGRLKRNLREGDTIARWGEDLFIWDISSLQKIDDVALIAEKMLTIVNHPVYVEGKEHVLTTSIGISLFPYDGGDSETLIKDAETALIRAKEMGRNTYQFYTEDLNARIVEHLTVRRQLREALRQHEFIPYYQPVVDLKSGRITSVEALVRWKNAEGKLVYPDEFLSVSEDSGLITPLDEWVLRSTCEWAKRWVLPGSASLHVSMNLSSGIFQRMDFVELLSGILKEMRLNPDCLELELAEHTLRENLEKSLQMLPALRSLGVHLCIDNFGSGGVPVALLKHFRSFKIEASLIKAAKRTGDFTSLFPIISLAHSLSVQVIAKGIETADELEFVRVQHCDGYQGNFFSPPVTPETFETLWRKALEEKQVPTEKDKPKAEKRRPVVESPKEPERLPWPVAAALPDWAQGSIPVELTTEFPKTVIRSVDPLVPNIPYDQPISRFKLNFYPEEAQPQPQRPKFPEAKDYIIICSNCRERFDALVAPWCSCLVSERTLTCPHCNTCFCTAALEYKLDFWTNSPQGMWDRRITEDREQEELQPNPKPNDVVRPLVLVVDDEPQILKIAARTIKGLGYGVVFAGNGAEGLEMAKEYLPDMVLSDALMPKMDGREMCRILKDDARFLKTKIVIMTSLSTRSRDRLAAFREFRMDDYVQKPLEFRALRQLLEKHLR